LTDAGLTQSFKTDKTIFNQFECLLLNSEKSIRTSFQMSALLEPTGNKSACIIGFAKNAVAGFHCSIQSSHFFGYLHRSNRRKYPVFLLFDRASRAIPTKLEGESGCQEPDQSLKTKEAAQR